MSMILRIQEISAHGASSRSFDDLKSVLASMHGASRSRKAPEVWNSTSGARNSKLP